MVTGSGLAYEDGGAMANGQVAIISSMTILEIIDLIFFAVSIKSSQRTATIPRYIYIYMAPTQTQHQETKPPRSFKLM